MKTIVLMSLLLTVSEFSNATSTHDRMTKIPGFIFKIIFDELPSSSVVFSKSIDLDLNGLKYTRTSTVKKVDEVECTKSTYSPPIEKDDYFCFQPSILRNGRIKFFGIGAKILFDYLKKRDGNEVDIPGLGKSKVEYNHYTGFRVGVVDSTHSYDGNYDLFNCTESYVPPYSELFDAPTPPGYICDIPPGGDSEG